MCNFKRLIDHEKTFFAIMMHCWKLLSLIKEALKLAFFRQVEYLEHQHLWVRLQAQNGQKQSTFFWNSSVYSCSEKLSLIFNRSAWLYRHLPNISVFLSSSCPGVCRYGTSKCVVLVCSSRIHCLNQGGPNVYCSPFLFLEESLDCHWLHHDSQPFCLKCAIAHHGFKSIELSV
jgi:hypothetical protein